jgi:hypothetical protein
MQYSDLKFSQWWLAACFMIISCLTYSSTLKTDVIYSYETTTDCHRTTYYFIPEDRTPNLVRTFVVFLNNTLWQQRESIKYIVSYQTLNYLSVIIIFLCYSMIETYRIVETTSITNVCNNTRQYDTPIILLRRNSEVGLYTKWSSREFFSEISVVLQALRKNSYRNIAINYFVLKFREYFIKITYFSTKFTYPLLSFHSTYFSCAPKKFITLYFSILLHWDIIFCSLVFRL